MPRTGLLDFARIRDAISFAALLDHYGLTPEKPGQRQVKISCPFHEDHTPSCSINLEKGLFNCFGCTAEGNVLDFIALMEGYSENPTYHAARRGLEIVGADLAAFRKEAEPAASPKATRSAAKKPPRAKTARPAQAPTHPPAETEPVPDDTVPEPKTNPVLTVDLQLDPTHPFLLTRHITPELAAEFGMGYCARGIMRGRIAIPIHNAEGQLVAYTGRWAGDELPDNEPRYKLPKEFQKSLELFNLHRAAALEQRFVVVVEGIWSVIRLHAAGVPAVALLGTSCSETQATSLANAGFRYAMLILDGDDAGRAAAPEVAHVLSQHLYVKTLALPDGIKPDTMEEAIIDRLRR